MITVVDYGMGNLRSVVKAVELFTGDVRVSDDPASIADSKALILPGDGAFGQAMENLTGRGWVAPLKKFIADGGFFLGICLGYQLLFSSSEEFGIHEGLGIIPGRVVRFPEGKLKVPHMGWNTVKFEKENRFLEGIESGSYFYFIHSFYPVADDAEWVAGTTVYGESFGSIVGRGNLLAAQFHPEKSHNDGLRIVENFVRLSCL